MDTTKVALTLRLWRSSCPPVARSTGHAGVAITAGAAGAALSTPGSHGGGAAVYQNTENQGAEGDGEAEEGANCAGDARPRHGSVQTFNIQNKMGI